MRTVLLAAVCLAVAGCGDAAKPTAAPAPTPAATAAPATVDVGMQANRFLPHRVVVGLGQTVRWTNGDAVVHTVASQDLRIASEGIRPGTTFTYRPKRAGRFAYYCTIHAGQTGVLLVR
jgi:plastocyanin